MGNMDYRLGDIDKRYWKYMRQGTTLCAAVFMMALLCATSYPTLIIPAIVGAAYALVIEIGAATAWRKVASKAPDSLPTCFMATSGLRFLVALTVMFVYFMLMGKTGKADMLTFILVFALFYLVALIHHSVFFAHKRKSNTEKQA